MTQETVNFVDLRAQHEEVRAEIETAIRDVIDRSSFIGGKYVAAFEREFAEYLGAQQVVAVANGTDALWLGLLAAGVKPGEAVITVPNTFIATVEAITRIGAAPLFVDIDLETALMDAGLLKAFLEDECWREDDGRLIHKASRRRVAAILPVHLYGQPVDLAALMGLAQAYDLPVIEDACQAHGARYLWNGAWKRAGTFGLASGFSFYPGKNLGAMGDGGAVATDDPELAQQMRWLRDHGSSEKYVHITPDGWNSRLDSLQAAVLSIKLKRLDAWNGLRRQAAAWYREALQGLPLAMPVEIENAEHVYHLYVVRSEQRETLRLQLGARNIHTGLHYPIPLHLQKAYAYLGIQPGSFPNAERSAETLLSLPMHPALTREQVMRVGQACGEILVDQIMV
jgi:dTDP-4-amino-4,6-dideoxygalactose transaminase